MIPILSDSATLQGNGLGGLSDAIECVVTDEVNGEYELRMRYPVTGEHYGEIQNNLIIFAEPMALASAQPFRIYRITKPLNGVVTIYARHLAYDMSGIVVKPFSALSLTAALSAVPTYSVPSCPFTLTSTRTITSKMEIDEPQPLWTLLGGSAGSFLDVYGGEWEFDGYTATLKTKLGEDRGVVIRYGKNLTELENDSDLSSTYGGVFPYWYDEEEGLVTITEGYVPVAGSIFTRILLLDCSSDFDEKPTEAQLRTKAQNYIDNNSVGSPKDSWKVSFAQLAQAGEYETQALLEEVQLGDTVSVIYEALGVNASARVVKTEWDVLGEKYKAVTIGRVKQNLASILVGQNKETERAISQTKSALERAIASSTDFIKNGTGVMRFIYNADGDLMEIVSLDNADLSQAQSVWRWNNGGFGHSSTGYNGSYTTAITQDGQIVADFITAGTLSGNRVRTGLIEDETGTNYWNLDTGEFHSQTLENAISQTEEGISLVSEKLNNIGGRNYLKYSNDSSTWTQYTPSNYFIAVVPLYVNMTSGNKYTITIWGDAPTRSDKTDTWYAVFWGGGSVHLGNIKINGGKGSVSFTAPSSGSGIQNTYLEIYNTPYSGAAGTTYGANIRAIKLEEGEVSTDWSAAPEDKTGNNEIISKINVSPENITISANKVDLQGYVTFTNLSTSGQTAINGGNITTNTISADKLSITDLNAIGATIGGFKIETNNIHTNGVAITSNATNSVGLSSSTFTRTINGTSRGNLKFAIGSNFGVANDGTLYASNGNFTGTITSNSATITGGKLNINAVTTFNASDYTSADVTRIRDYILEGGIPTMDDYTKYDIDRNGRLNISDLIKVRDLVNGEASSFTATSYVDIDPSQSNSVIHIWSSGTGYTQGTFLGAGLIQTNTVRTGDCWMNTQGVWLGSNNVRTGLLYPDSLNFFHSNGNNMMMLEGSSGLTFSDSSGNVTASYPASWMIRAKEYTLGDTSISAGTPGTRATQKQIDATMSGYDILCVRLSYVGDSSLCNVVPFIGSSANPNYVYINYYRASGSAGSEEVNIKVFYIKNDAYSVT